MAIRTASRNGLTKASLFHPSSSCQFLSQAHFSPGLLALPSAAEPARLAGFAVEPSVSTCFRDFKALLQSRAFFCLWEFNGRSLTRVALTFRQRIRLTSQRLY